MGYQWDITAPKIMEKCSQDVVDETYFIFPGFIGPGFSLFHLFWSCYNQIFMGINGNL
jgi:hypothetical protein